MVPSKDMQTGAEDTAASQVLEAKPRAAAAYDHVPFKSATCVYTLDTSTNIFLLHSIQVKVPQIAMSAKQRCRSKPRSCKLL